MFARDMTIKQSQLIKLKTEDRSVVSAKLEVLGEIERFYDQLYASVTQPVANASKDRRSPISPDTLLQYTVRDKNG